MMALEMLARQTSWLISISKMDFSMIAAVLGTTSTDIWPATTMLLRYCYRDVLYTAIEERLNVAGLDNDIPVVTNTQYTEIHCRLMHI